MTLRWISVVVLWILLQVVVVTRSHVVLTFPPARKYALDFLDNVRLPRTMCGMPKGLSPSTSLLAGTTINVTWNLAYPHEGGYKLEVLDFLERPVMDLTPMIQNSRFLSYSNLAQYHEITLPKDFECKNCTIRLLREASEINPDFILRSCADVDIVKSYHEDCMGNGIYQHGKCNCRIPFVGHRCQYENECGNDGDCGEHGKCLFIDSTNYPMKQCFCELGWFGNRCSLESKLNSKALMLDSHNQQDLSDDMKLYWKILNASEEIEIVIMAKTISYVAVGWRPKDIGIECRMFPNLMFPTSSKSDIRKGKELFHETMSSLNANSTKEMESVETATTVFVQKIEGATSTSIVSNTNIATDDVTLPSTKLTSVTSSPKIRFPTRRPNLARRFPGKPLTSRTTSQPTTAKTTSEPLTSSSTLASTEAVTTMKSDPETTVVFIEVRSESSIQEDQETQEALSTSEEQTSLEEGSVVSSEKAEDVISAEHVSAYSKKPTSTVDDMDAAASEETVSNVQVKSYGPDSGKTKREIKQAANIEESPYYSSVPLHPMDCNDMVIGSVRGDYSRIGDYYSRDLSAPQLDSFWGGKSDLTAAAGFEANGMTVIMFRKKLKAEHPSDHNIKDSMHVIWAMGQTHGENTETSNGAVSFYKPDALKYHGRGSQRGMTMINFQSTAEAVYQDSSAKSDCRGEWRHPSKCIADDCEYKATWEYENETDDISFTIFTNHTNTWTGIGFSNDTKMNNTDVIIGWVNDNGKHFMMDMWISGYTAPILDPNQDIEFERGQKNTSGTTLMFKRKRNTGDVNDLAFTNSECLYLIFPYHGGSYNSVNKKIQMHTKTPAVSSKRICMPECESLHDVKSETSDEFSSVPIEFTTDLAATTVSSSTKPTYTLVIRLPLEDAIFTESEEIQKAAKSKIQSEVHSVLKNVEGYKSVVVSNVSRDPNVTNWLLAAMNIQVEQSMDLANESALEDVIRSSVAEGKIGSLRVDPNFIQLQVPEDWSYKSTTESTYIDAVSTADSHLIAIYAIIAAVSILGLLICIQVICTTCRYIKSKNNRISKEKLLANSGWKDYSTTASSNYSYEPFSSGNYEENTGKVSKNPVGGSRSESNKGRTDHRSNNNHHLRNSLAEAPSLQHSSPTNENTKPHYSHRSESLPRVNMPSSQPVVRGSNYATHDRAMRNNPPKTAMELQPDFYFMPSQRRYKGETSRMYVDYNNPNYHNM